MICDRLPDTHVEPEPIELAPLGHEPSEETFGLLEPIAPYTG